MRLALTVGGARLAITGGLSQSSKRMKTRFLMMNLLAGLYWFDEALQLALKERGLTQATRSQSLVLMNLAMGENRPTRLARNLGVTRQAISQLLTQMEAQGLICRRSDPSDGRAHIVDFSPSSSIVRDTAQKSLTEIEKVLGSRIGAQRLESLREALGMDWGEPAFTTEAPPQAFKAPRAAKTAEPKNVK